FGCELANRRPVVVGCFVGEVVGDVFAVPIVHLARAFLMASRIVFSTPGSKNNCWPNCNSGAISRVSIKCQIVGSITLSSRSRSTRSQIRSSVFLAGNMPLVEHLARGGFRPAESPKQF